MLPLLLAMAAFLSFGQETDSDTLAEDSRGYFDRRTLLAITNQDYAVTPGDVYTLTYNRDLATVTQYLIVEADFKVNLSLFGIEDVKNLTFLEFKKLVEDKVLTAYPKSLPHLTIRSTGIFEVFIKGEVKSAGFKLAWGLSRLSEIVSESLTPYSSIRNIQVTSSSGRTRYYDSKPFRRTIARTSILFRNADTGIVFTLGKQSGSLSLPLQVFTVIEPVPIDDLTVIQGYILLRIP